MYRIICVKIGQLPNGYEPILEYYNTKKTNESQKLEKLDRSEGGFKIRFNDYNTLICDENNKIHQLRWYNGKLVSNNYYGFTSEQLDLLYESLVCCLGKENVYIIDK